MKLYNNILVTLIITALSVNGALAFGFDKNPDKIKKTGKIEKPKKADKVKKVKKEKKEEYERAPLTNDIHSVFSLQDCVNIAVKYNHSIRYAVYNEEVYKTKIGQAWANYFPELTAGATFSKTSNHYTGSMSYASMHYNLGYVPTVSANMLLFDFGKTKASADSAKRMYEAAKEDTKESINDIIYNIKSTYFNILFAQAQVKVYEDTVRDYEMQLERAWGFYRLGKKPKVDVVTAEYNLGKAKLNLIKAINVLEVAKVQLSKIMGVPDYVNYELSDELSINKFNETDDELITKAMEVRPELISAQKNLEAARMDLRAARREYAPNIGISGSYGNGLGNKYDVKSAQFEVGIEYSNFNLMSIKKKADEAKALYKRALAQYNNTKDGVYYNVKKTYLELNTAKEAIIIAKLALDEAKEQYRQVSGRYKAGVGDAIELKDGENTYLNARLDFYNSVLNYNVTAAELEKEVGVPLIFSDEKILELKKEEL